MSIHTSLSLKTALALEWVLRIAVAGEFIGHGVFAVQGKAQWVGWIGKILTVDVATATTLLLVVGIMDVILGILVLTYARLPRGLLVWMVFWGLWTALLRPLVGEPIWDFVERFANWGAPLALLLLRGCPKNLKECLLP